MSKDKSEWRDEDFIAELETELTAKTAELDRAVELIKDCYEDSSDSVNYLLGANLDRELRRELKQFLSEIGGKEI